MGTNNKIPGVRIRSSRILNLSTTNIQGQITLLWGAVLCMQDVQQHPWPLLTTCQQHPTTPSYNNHIGAKCCRKAKLALVENPCCKALLSPLVRTTFGPGLWREAKPQIETKQGSVKVHLELLRRNMRMVVKQKQKNSKAEFLFKRRSVILPQNKVIDKPSFNLFILQEVRADNRARMSLKFPFLKKNASFYDFKSSPYHGWQSL